MQNRIMSILDYGISNGGRSANINISLTNGNMIISGDSGSGEDNWNGTWVKQ